MRRTILTSILVALALSLPTAMARGETPEKDAFVFLSKGGNSKSFEFNKYSRVTFGDNAFILTPWDASLVPVTLSYGDYYRMLFGNHEDAGIGHRPAVDESRLCYDNGTGTVTMMDDNGDSFLITVYSVDGILRAKGYGKVDLSRLPKGIYVAMGTDGTTRHILKLHK